jgi:hypothetical protein
MQFLWLGENILFILMNAMFVYVLFYFSLLTKYNSEKKRNLLFQRIDCICNRACYSNSHSTYPLIDYIELAENAKKTSSHSEHLTARIIHSKWQQRECTGNGLFLWKYLKTLKAFIKEIHRNGLCRILNIENLILYWSFFSDSRIAK